MKTTFPLALMLFISAFAFTSCNNDEGLGGSSSLEGYVFNVIHSDDNFTFRVDTFPAAKEDVFLVFGNEDYFGDDVETDQKGMYRFDYLRKGNYTVYALSELVSGESEAVSKDVKVGSGTTIAPKIYIHSGKAYGTAMVKGSVKALYYNKGSKVDEGPAVEKRVFISNHGEETYFDDVRVGNNGIFIFQKILPGIYDIWVTTENPTTEKLTVKMQTIEVTKAGEIYELSEEFTVIITV